MAPGANMRLRTAVVFSFLVFAVFASTALSQTLTQDSDRLQDTAIPAHAVKAYHDHRIRDIDAIGNRNIGCGRGFGNWYSLERQIAMGKNYSEQVESTSKLITDPAVTEFINQLGQNLGRNPDSQVPFPIKVLHPHYINALSLPTELFYLHSS